MKDSNKPVCWIIAGPNGAGKTTSFYQVVGLIKPDQGNVFLNDEDITKLPMYKRAQMGIGYLPQELLFLLWSYRRLSTGYLKISHKSSQKKLKQR
jgi:ABC-type lipopolysaccharide export system ATPase subunit